MRGEATFLEDEDYDTLVRITRLALPTDTPAGNRFVNAYWTTRVVDSMRRAGHGGIVLLVPSGSSGWRDALTDAPKYECSPPFRGLRDALDRLPRTPTPARPSSSRSICGMKRTRSAKSPRSTAPPFSTWI